jgi:hypothetical protein
MGEKYNYKAEIEYSIIEHLPLGIKSKCPTKKIVRIVVNLLKINPFECALLCWLLKKTNLEQSLESVNHSEWNINFSILEETLDKKVLLLLLLNGYNVKNHLLIAGA